MHSADRVLPEFQHPQVGDTLGYGPNRMRLERVEPDTYSPALRGRQLGLELRTRRPRRETRLISRNRFRLPSLTAKIGMIPMEPASLVMERKMLDGIKRRAERLADKDAV